MISDHELVDESLGNGAGNLLESLLLVLSSSVGHVHLGSDTLHVQVVHEGLLGAPDAFVGPLSKEEGFDSKSCFCGVREKL